VACSEIDALQKVVAAPDDARRQAIWCGALITCAMLWNRLVLTA
jgi:hypothetical protein